MKFNHNSYQMVNEMTMALDQSMLVSTPSTPDEISAQLQLHSRRRKRKQQQQKEKERTVKMMMIGRNKLHSSSNQFYVRQPPTVILYTILILAIYTILFTLTSDLLNNGGAQCILLSSAPSSSSTASLLPATISTTVAEGGQQQQQYTASSASPSSSQTATTSAQQQQPQNLVAPTIDYSHNMRILKLPRSTPIGSLIYRLKGSDADPNTQLVFGVSGIEARGLLDVVQAGKSWNEADVFLLAPLEQTIYNLTIYVTDGNKTTQVDSTIFVTEPNTLGSNGEFNSINNSSYAGGDFTGAARSPSSLSPFVNPKHVFHVPENAQPDETIGAVVVLESEKSDLPVRFELRGKGSDKFAIKYVFGPTRGQSRAELVLAQLVDYEKQNLFNLKVLALNAWTNTRFDTRNVAVMDIVITVGDVQDTAPIFKSFPHWLKLANNHLPGAIVARVEAEDGDYADQRPINYALDAGSPLASYFDIDKTSGEIKLVRSVQELALHGALDLAAAAGSSMLSVFASEQPDTTSYQHLWPPMLTRLDLPLLLVDVINEAPRFVGGWQTQLGGGGPGGGLIMGGPSSSSGADQQVEAQGVIHAYLAEPYGGGQADPSGAQVGWYTNSTPTGWPMLDKLSKSMQGKPMVLDLGQGSNGTFELSLEGEQAHLFELEPSLPVSKQTTLLLSVKQSLSSEEKALFDYENNNMRRQRRFVVDIVARDFGTVQRLASRMRCHIELIDVDDNYPQFDTDLYIFSVYENAALGQLIGQVHARDADSSTPQDSSSSSGNGGGFSGANSGSAQQRVRYTALNGQDSQMFRLNPDSGQITLDGHLDREKKSHYFFLLEAKDSFGTTNSKANYTQVQINVLDVNDNAPQFLQPHYDVVLQADGTFHEPLVVRATDPDEPQSANSQVAYEIIAGNQNDLFYIDSHSGAIYPNSATSSPQQHNPSAINIPSILSEPITPYKPTTTDTHTNIQPGATGSGSLAGKILPNSPHEIEETTYPSLGNHINNNNNNRIQAAHVPRQRADESPPVTNYSLLHSPVLQSYNPFQYLSNNNKNNPSRSSNSASGDADQTPRFDSPRSVTPSIGTENIQQQIPHQERGGYGVGGSNGTNNRLLATSIGGSGDTNLQQPNRIMSLPPLDAEQLPAIDLLLNLDSEHLPSRLLVDHQMQASEGEGGDTGTSFANSSQDNSISTEKQHQRRSLLPATAYVNQQVIRTPPLTTLIVRAHDFGIPLRSSTVKVNIYNQALVGRSLSVILNGTVDQLEQRREQIERAFSSMTGSRATIESFEALSESSAISVARVRMSVPQHSLVNLTDLSPLISAIDYHPQANSIDYHQSSKYPSHSPSPTNQQPPLYSIGPDGQLTPATGSAGQTVTANNITSGKHIDVSSFPLDHSPFIWSSGGGVGPLERRLLIYIIIVAVCILALLVVWMIYSCSREDQVKIIEKDSNMQVNGNYRPMGVTTGDGDTSNAFTRNQGTMTPSGGGGNNKTYAKTTNSFESYSGGIPSSPIGNQLAKSGTTTNQRNQQRGTQKNSMNELMLPNQLKGGPWNTSDHYSMYNGQVWFEPNHPPGMMTHTGGAGSSGIGNGRSLARPSTMMMMSPERRASSAPSTGGLSLDSALHSAILGSNSQQHHLRALQSGGNSITPLRNAGGQFFPNTLGYMENLAALTGDGKMDGAHMSNVASFHQQRNGGGGVKNMMARRGRGQKVGPISGSGEDHQQSSVAAGEDLGGIGADAGGEDSATILSQAPSKPPRSRFVATPTQTEGGHINEAYSANEDDEEDEDTIASGKLNRTNQSGGRKSLSRQGATTTSRTGSSSVGRRAHRKNKGRATRRRNNQEEDDDDDDVDDLDVNDDELLSGGDSIDDESVILNSDQELLGFDSTGTPIIATHTRPRSANKMLTTSSNAPLLIEMLDPQHQVNLTDPRLVLSPAATPGSRGLPTNGMKSGVLNTNNINVNKSKQVPNQQTNTATKQTNEQNLPQYSIGGNPNTTSPSSGVLRKTSTDADKTEKASPSLPPDGAVGKVNSSEIQRKSQGSITTNSTLEREKDKQQHQEQQQTSLRESEQKTKRPVDGATSKVDQQDNLNISDSNKPSINTNGRNKMSIIREESRGSRGPPTTNKEELVVARDGDSGDAGAEGRQEPSPTKINQMPISRAGSGTSQRSKFKGDELRKANTRVDLMSELNNKLNTRRLMSVDNGVTGPGDVISSTPNSKRVQLAQTDQLKSVDVESPPLRGEESQSSSRSSSAGDNGSQIDETPPPPPPPPLEASSNNHLRDMKNGELLEKQSIFALTYSGLSSTNENRLPI